MFIKKSIRVIKIPTVIFTLALCVVTFSGEPARAADAGGKIEITGEVVIAYDNKELLLKDDNYHIVKIDKKHWSMGIQIGEFITVRGERIKNSPLQNWVKAVDIKRSGNTRNFRRRPVGLRTVPEALRSKVVGDLVGIRGKIAGFVGYESGTMILGDLKGVKIIVPLNVKGEPNRADTHVYGAVLGNEMVNVGEEVILVGVWKKQAGNMTVDPILVRSLTKYLLPDKSLKAQSIKEALQKREVGKKIKVKGRIALFIGDQNETLLYEGKDIIAVRRSEKYLSLDAPAGEEVEAVGTFGFTTYNDREYGVLEEARIIPVRLLEGLSENGR